MSIKELLFGKKVTPNIKSGSHYPGSVQSWLPVADIQGGIVITTDGRFVKILEVLPVNFYLKSQIEQQNVIFYFASYLKIAPDNIQMLAVTQKADIDAYVKRLRGLYENEENENCREMILDNISEVEYLADREALTRRFFIAFQYEPRMRIRGNNVQGIIQRLRDEAETAKQYLDLCGLEIIQPKYEDVFLGEVIYSLLNRNTSKNIKLPESVFTMTGEVHANN